MERDGHRVIVWEDRIYAPFCVVSKSDCGAQRSFLNGDLEDIVSRYRDFPPEA